MPHNHGHNHAPAADRTWAFGLGVALNAGYIVAEVGFGLWVSSLALLADAAHNLSDVLGLLLAWGAYYLSRLKPTERYTYGFRSTTILAALFNALILLAAVGGIAWEAIRRFGDPQPVSEMTVVWVAAAGVGVNALTAVLFLRGRHSDLNIRGAFLHMAADAGVSVGVVVAGLAIRWTGADWIDPTTSLAIAAVILFSTWGLLKDSVNLALQAVPRGIDPDEVRKFLVDQPGVEAVHDLHIWAMSTTENALTAHLVKPQQDDPDEFLACLSAALHDRFGIGHSTIQLERDAAAAQCRQVPPEVV